MKASSFLSPLCLAHDNRVRRAVLHRMVPVEPSSKGQSSACAKGRHGAPRPGREESASQALADPLLSTSPQCSPLRRVDPELSVANCHL